MSKKITYLLGAGASFHSCPIWKEQGAKMIDLAKSVHPNATFAETEKNTYPNDLAGMFWNMGHHGIKANEFNTIDTYAKKLYLNESWNQLNDLKTSISMFFTIWQSINEKKLKIYDQNTNRFKVIDQRYISLLATCLEKSSNKSRPKLNDNVRFVTWNYDLQLEAAYKLFCIDIEWGNIDKGFSFMPDENNSTKNLCVCHLNGFHGYYGTGKSFNHILDITEGLSLNKIIEAIEFVPTSVKNKQISFAPYINYAWEKDSPLAKIAREQARKFFAVTDILIIIGYSFPSFNREIDKDLLDSCKDHVQKIIFQDPNGSAEYLSEAFDIDKKKIEIITDNMHQFILPSVF